MSSQLATLSVVLLSRFGACLGGGLLCRVKIQEPALNELAQDPGGVQPQDTIGCSGCMSMYACAHTSGSYPGYFIQC